MCHFCKIEIENRKKIHFVSYRFVIYEMLFTISSVITYNGDKKIPNIKVQCFSIYCFLPL